VESSCNLLSYDKKKDLSNEEYEKLFLYRWSHVTNKDNKITRDFFSCDDLLLHVHGCIQQEVIISIKSSGKYKFINVNVAKRLHISKINIQST
jgi:hypothetical protein